MNMSNKILKNIDLSTILTLKDLVNYQPGQIVSKTLVQNKNVSLTLFAFDKEEEISTHSSHGDAMVYVIDGSGQFTIGDKTYSLSEGQTIVMPSEVPHAVYAPEQFKMFLIVIF